MNWIDRIFLSIIILGTGVILMNALFKKIDATKWNQSIYYEYTIIDNDTVPIDTVFIHNFKIR